MEPSIRKPTEYEKEQAKSWPIWEKQASVFPWKYDQQETCLILEGQVTVTNEEGQQFDFGAGDYVVFPKGMTCQWHVKQPVKKHYNFA